jgi:hypothetical protein
MDEPFQPDHISNRAVSAWTGLSTSYPEELCKQPNTLTR